MRRTKFLSDRQFLVPGLTDLSEEDLEAPPSPSIAPFVFLAIACAFLASVVPIILSKGLA